MRGVIESYDTNAGTGTVRGMDGAIYPFTRTVLLRRSKLPHPLARAVFRMKNGKIYRMSVVSYGGNSEWGGYFLEGLLYLPLAVISE